MLASEGINRTLGGFCALAAVVDIYSPVYGQGQEGSSSFVFTTGHILAACSVLLLSRVL